jgi:hypothetical protein
MDLFPGYFPKSWKIIKIAMIEMASTKISITTIPIKIFDAAEGLRLKALMTEYPKTAMTIDGPKTAINMIETISKVSANCISYLLARCQFQFFVYLPPSTRRRAILKNTDFP